MKPYKTSPTVTKTDIWQGVALGSFVGFLIGGVAAAVTTGDSLSGMIAGAVVGGLYSRYMMHQEYKDYLEYERHRKSQIRSHE